MPRRTQVRHCHRQCANRRRCDDDVPRPKSRRYPGEELPCVNRGPCSAPDMDVHRAARSTLRQRGDRDRRVRTSLVHRAPKAACAFVGLRRPTDSNPHLPGHRPESRHANNNRRRNHPTGRAAGPIPQSHPLALRASPSSRRTLPRHLRRHRPQFRCWRRAPTAPPSRLFAPDSFWNAQLPADAAIDPESTRLVGVLLSQVQSDVDAIRGPWIDEREYSTPLYTVTNSQPRVRVQLDGSTDAALRAAFSAVPLPANAAPAAGLDGHLTVPGAFERSTVGILEVELEV